MASPRPAARDVGGAPPPAASVCLTGAALLCRTPTLGLFVLLARGWTLEHSDERYDSHLLRRELDA